jgi:hypothetical protein
VAIPWSGKGLFYETRHNFTNLHQCVQRFTQALNL